MLSPHAWLAAAQTVVYAPIVPLVWFVIIRNWHIRPRMPWWPMALFSFIRFAGGPLIIGQTIHPENRALFITALIFVNVGIVPLIASIVGLIRLILMPQPSPAPETSRLHKVTNITQTWMFLAICYLAIGGGLQGQDSKDETGRGFSISGYSHLIVAILILAWVLVKLQRTHCVDIETVTPTMYLRGAWVSMPFLLLRAVYGLIFAVEFVKPGSLWNPLLGNPAVFILMALVPEYIVICIILYLGFHRMRTARQPLEESDGEHSLKE
ncbi:hypothetical protein BX600DRAFT_62054 [Xylariales sp. PMI_506]|nr:hypothetical protein BX600DRAFT_62054 [Xylariales sp. PMI_506]